MIPKVIMQTSCKQPNVYRVAKLKEFCPDYEYEHFTDDGIIQFLIDNPDEKFPRAVEFFKKIPPGAWRADFFRYYYLWQKGGVYMDTDVMLNTSLDNIIKDQKFISVTSFVDQAFNGFICTVPRHSIMFLALRHMYNLYSLTPPPPVPYHYFVQKFMEIIQIVKKTDSNIDISLYENIDENTGVSTITNSEGQAVAFHYFKYKEFPVTFITKSNDHC